MIRSIIFVLFHLSCFNSNAQSPPYFTIGVEEFSNIDVYSVLYEDTTDLLYAATNRGVFVYRQNKFTILRSHPKQKGVSFFQLKKDNIGRLFCCNTAGQVFLIKNNSLELFYQLPKLTIGYGFAYFFDNKNNLIISTAGVIRKVNSSGIESVLFNAEKTKEYFPESPNWSAIRRVTQMANGDVYFGAEENSYYLKYSNEQFSFHTLSIKDGFTASSFFQFGERICYITNGNIKCISDPNFSDSVSIDHFSRFHQLGPNNLSILNGVKGLRILTLENDLLD